MVVSSKNIKGGGMFCPNCGKKTDLAEVEGEEFYSCRYCLKEYAIAEIENEEVDDE